MCGILTVKVIYLTTNGYVKFRAHMAYEAVWTSSIDSASFDLSIIDQRYAVRTIIAIH